MKRAQLVEAQKTVIDVVDIPKAPPGGLVIKTAYSGICHSDMHQWEDYTDFGDRKVFYSKNKYSKLPVVQGHEIAGIVHELGPEQSSDYLKIGDRVAVFPWRGCGKCGYCTILDVSQCEPRRYSFGLGIPGGFASHVVVPESHLVVKVPDSIPLDIACMLPCSGITAYNAIATVKSHVELVTKLEGKASLLIVGAGGLGMWCLQNSKSILPPTTKIVVADIVEENLVAARERGCDDTVMWVRGAKKEDSIKQTQEKGLNGGFDAVIDFVNAPATCEIVFKCVLRRGVLAMVGLFGGAANISLPEVVLGARRIQGVHVGRFHHLQELVQLVEKDKLIPPPMHYFKLEEVDEAMKKLQDGSMKGRGIIKFD